MEAHNLLMAFLMPLLDIRVNQRLFLLLCEIASLTTASFSAQTECKTVSQPNEVKMSGGREKFVNL